MRHLFSYGAVCAIGVLALFPVVAAADCMHLPDFEGSLWWFENYDEASLWILPNGEGPPLTEAIGYGGIPIDKSITAQLLDPVGYPMWNFDLDEVYLIDPDGLVAFCGGEQPASAYGSSEGLYVFDGPLAGGGCHPAGAYALGVMVCGMPLLFSPSQSLGINSPDINGDLVVNLTDLSLFAQNYYGIYDYRSDYIWDGYINLSDLSIMSQGIGAVCLPD